MYKATSELYLAQKRSSGIVYVYFVPVMSAKIGFSVDIFINCLYFLMESSFQKLFKFALVSN